MSYETANRLMYRRTVNSRISSVHLSTLVSFLICHLSSVFFIMQYAVSSETALLLMMHAISKHSTEATVWFAFLLRRRFQGSVIFVLTYFLVLVLVAVFEIFFSFSFVLVFIIFSF